MWSPICVWSYRDLMRNLCTLKTAQLIFLCQILLDKIFWKFSIDKPTDNFSEESTEHKDYNVPLYSGDCVKHDNSIARNSRSMRVQNTLFTISIFCDLQTRLQMNQLNCSIKPQIIAFARVFVSANQNWDSDSRFFVTSPAHAFLFKLFKTAFAERVLAS